MKKQEIFVLCLIIFVYLSFVGMNVSKPYMGDEVEFIKAARAIAEMGKPVYQSSIGRTKSVALWHPPLFVNLLALFMILFGEGAIALRSLSVLFLVGSIILVYLITKSLIKNDGKIWAILSTLIYALNPLTIQSAIIIDVDGGVLNFFSLLFIYFWIKGKGGKFLIPSMFFIMWAKETTPLLLAGSFFIYYGLNRDWKNLYKIFLVFLISSVLFLISFFIYCHTLNLDIWIFLNLISRVGKISSGATKIIRAAWSIKTFAYFVGPFWTFLFVFVSLKRIFNIIKGENLEVSDFFGLVSLLGICMFGYVGLTGWNFPKYYIVVLTFGTVFIMKNLSDIIEDLSIDKKTLIKLIFLVIALILYFFFFIGDPLIPEISLTASTVSSLNELTPIFKTSLLYFMIPILVTLIIFFDEFVNKKQRFYYFIFILIFLSLYIGIFQFTANYSTHNLYGDSGLKEVLEFLKENKIDSTNIVSYFQVGYYYGENQYYEVSRYYSSSERFREKIIKNEQTKYLIIYEKDIKRIGDNMDYFRLVKKIGSYYVFKKI